MNETRCVNCDGSPFAGGNPNCPLCHGTGLAPKRYSEVHPPAADSRDTEAAQRQCDCIAWKANIDKVNAPHVLQAIRSGTKGYDGDAFYFCPWCGAPLASSMRTAMSSESLFTEEHQRAIGEACEKLWNGEPHDNPIYGPRPADHPLRIVANKAHDALNAALALETQYLKALNRLSLLTARAVRAEGAMPSLELLARADGLLSLVYHRYQYEKIPHDIREDMLRTSYELRAITDAMRRPTTP